MVKTCSHVATLVACPKTHSVECIIWPPAETQ